MLYHYLRYMNYIFTLFGLRKPFPLSSGKPNSVPFWSKLWTAILIVLLIASYIITAETQISFNIQNLRTIPKSGKASIQHYDRVNQMIINIMILANNLTKDENICLKLYESVDNILREMRIVDKNIKMLAIKFYFGLAVSTAFLLLFVVLEIMKSNPYILLVSIPTYLTSFHLVVHLCILLAVLKAVARKISDMLKIDQKISYNTFFKEKPLKWKSSKYLINSDGKFFEDDCKGQFELKFLCKIYDDISTCIQLLEQYHGIQMLLTFWLIFTKAVFGATMIFCNITDVPVLVVGRSILPFLWCFYGCYVNADIDKQVEDIDLLIVRYMIDFKCEPPRKATLQTFKQLVNTNRMQFTACSLFHLSYSMILGTIVNVITYSIILIQMFLSDTTDTK